MSVKKKTKKLFITVSINPPFSSYTNIVVFLYKSTLLVTVHICCWLIRLLVYITNKKTNKKTEFELVIVFTLYFTLYLVKKKYIL